MSHPSMSTASPAVLSQLTTWVELGALRSLDLALARFIAQQLPHSSELLLLSVALVSERNAHGHVCLDLTAALAAPKLLLSAVKNAPDGVSENQARDELSARLTNLSLSAWLAELSASGAVETRISSDTSDGDSKLGDTPLVLAGSAERPLLYLRRYWLYEQKIKAALNLRLAVHHSLPNAPTQRLLAALFPPVSATVAVPELATDWQKVACLLAARSHFAIITGGPGTGKTTTVVKLLALLQGLRLTNQEAPLQIHLAAPTGKAAARLSESIAGSVAQLPLPSDLAEPLRNSIPKEVTTLHRLLGSLPNTRHFRHHATNPLPTDLVVVDEASMMDVEMMAQLVDALPGHARLILLGDKDQLASVEAGSILGDLCQTADVAHYTPTTQDWITQLSNESLSDEFIDPKGSALQQATCMLRHSYRFSAHPGIGELAHQVNSGLATPASLTAIFDRQSHSLHNLRLPAASNQYFIDLAPLARLAVAGYQDYLTLAKRPPQLTSDPDANVAALNSWALAVFVAHNQFQLLTAVRQGTFGIDNLNQLIFKALQKKQLLPDGEPLWYSGRPLLVTRNDYSLKLMNGDIGICLYWPGVGLRVAFPDGEQGIRWVLPSRLQGVETVFAMTVHKSQGSEFTHTALVLPDYGNPVLTKELIYTGITRSKEKFTLIHSKDAVLQQALHSQVKRASGLTKVGEV
ncbi:exodeoxyribonuclease V subunit alpha [Oceanisphaera profunda]|nr:exodeoxyribonuclease V subunit alpha [Oceanisphaera profunda]